jgi:hypothetical protein
MTQEVAPATIGRPTKLTPEIAATICGLVAQGNYLKAAAGAVAVDPGTLHRWVSKGAAPDADPLYRDFRDQLQKARAMAEAKMVKVITTAANQGQWTAAAWWLERTNPEEWGKRDRVEVTGADGGPIETRQIADQRIATLAERLAARLPNPTNPTNPPATFGEG